MKEKSIIIRLISAKELIDFHFQLAILNITCLILLTSNLVLGRDFDWICFVVWAWGLGLFFTWAIMLSMTKLRKDFYKYLLERRKNDK